MKLAIFVVLLISISACQTTKIVTETDLAKTPAQKIGGHSVLYVRGGYDDVCQSEIEQASKYLPGVHFVYWSQSEQTLLVDFDESKTNIDSISVAIARYGYDTERHKADDSIYKRLLFQCRYK